MAKNIKVIFILSQGHSGSTFLGLILGSHPEIFGLGELARLEHHLPKVCGICDSSCEYWTKRASLPVLRRYLSQGWNIQAISREIHRYHRSIYSYLAEWFDYSIFVDSSKYPDWIRRQLRYRRNWRSMTPILIHLTRDGRAVINSHLRKSPERGIEAATSRWLRSTGKILRLYDEFQGPKYRLAYENLASRPEEMISSLCQFLQINYFPGMLNYWEHEHHQIGGNTGARSLISQRDAESHGSRAVKSGEWHDGYYKNMGRTIKLDLRWKTELPPKYLEYFERHAGELNRPFSFDGNEP
jgi:hypothetical protein